MSLLKSYIWKDSSTTVTIISRHPDIDRLLLYSGFYLVFDLGSLILVPILTACCEVWLAFWPSESR